MENSVLIAIQRSQQEHSQHTAGYNLTDPHGQHHERNRQDDLVSVTKDKRYDHGVGYNGRNGSQELCLRSIHVPIAPIRVAREPKMISGSMAPVTRLAIRQPINSPGTGGGSQKGKDGEGFRDSEPECCRWRCRRALANSSSRTT